MKGEMSRSASICTPRLSDPGMRLPLVMGIGRKSSYSSLSRSGVVTSISSGIEVDCELVELEQIRAAFNVLIGLPIELEIIASWKESGFSVSK